MACTDVQTIQAGNGSKTQFSFDFPYIFKSEIHVYFWNAVTKEYDEKLTTDATYPWQITDANPTIVEFTGTAPPSPATPVDPGEPTVDNVKIRRITKVDDIRALFNPGSAIRSDDLNKNFEQLRYAIQEANCAGIPDDVDEYLKNYYWDRYDNTLYDGDTWVSDDTKIATTAALDARFQDEVNDTFTKAELAANSNAMPDDDVAVPTTGALDNYINEVITNDIGSSDGVTITDDGDGTITVGLADNSVDFDKIKDADQIQLADQIADPDVEGTDNNIFTAKAATRRFNNYYQNEAPAATAGIGEGQVWVDPNDDLTLSVWSGSAWVGITSGGTFTNQPKVVYVDASSGDDSNDGHRISRPKQSIKAAVTQINADATHGNGSIVVVAPGVYQEACPIQIQKRDVAIVGTSVRNCVVHPTPATETATMFEVNSGTYLKNLTFTGMKASGTRGDTGSLWENATYGLPPTQGWNVAFYDDAMIYKSPYVQNCTNFSDSEIDNSDLDFYAGDENKGRAGDLDSAPTGGGLLVDGSTPHADSPLRSIVCDSYTHTGLDAPGIFVTNNGYMQATSSYAFFNHAHITCINGGQANLAASTTDFGRYGLVASGKSTSAIFTSTIDGAVSDGAISFNIDAPTAASGWHGSATRPQGNMLVTVNSVTYPILSATANGSGWTVTISRPNSSNRSENLGVNGAISDGAAVSFFLRSMIASSGHTMEYVGSGTNYTALPENGGVPVDANQKIELDNGKIWTATTDQNGKFQVGGNQTDDPFFEVDQQLGFVTIPEGSIAFNLLSDLTPQLGGNLDVNSNEIVSTSNGDITINPNGTGQVVLDANVKLPAGSASAPSFYSGTDTNTGLYFSAADEVSVATGGTQRIVVDSSGNVGIGTSSAARQVHISDTSTAELHFTNDSIGNTSSDGSTIYVANTGELGIRNRENSFTTFYTNNSERVRIDSSGNVGIGTSSPSQKLHVNGTAFVADDHIRLLLDSGNGRLQIRSSSDTTNVDIFGSNGQAFFAGNVGIGTTSPGHNLEVKGSFPDFAIVDSDTTNDKFRILHNGGATQLQVDPNNVSSSSHLLVSVDGSERMRIDSSGNLGIGLTSPQTRFHSAGTTNGAQATFGTASSGLKISTFQKTHNDAGVTLDAQHSSNGTLRFATTGTERLRIDSSGIVKIGTGSTVTPDANADDFVIDKGAADTGLSILSTTTGRIYFGDAADHEAGSIRYVHTDNSLRFETASSEALRIDSSGNVGIGISNPGYRLEIEATANDIARFSGANTGNLVIRNATSNEVILHTGTSDALIFGTNGNNERMRIDSSGRLLVGTTSADLGNMSVASTAHTSLSIRAGSGNHNSNIFFADATSGNGAAVGVIQFKHSDNSLRISVDGPERMRITSDGCVLINGTSVVSRSQAVFFQIGEGSNSFGIQHNNSSNVIELTTEVGTTVARNHFTFKNSNGTVGSINTSGSSTAFNTSSDYRLKENIVDLNGAITRIKQLQPRRFNFIADDTTTVDGFIAHEAQTVVPEAVTGTHNEVDDDGNAVMQGIDQSKLVPLLTAALQEAIAKIETLEAKVAALEAE